MQRCKRDFPYVATLDRRLVNDRVKGTDFHWSHLARYRFVEDRHSLTSSNGGEAGKNHIMERLYARMFYFESVRPADGF